YNLGYSYELLGNTKSAESNYRLALSINPQYDSAAKGLSRIGF
ncbi:MAG: pilus assembly protein PilF, partial [Flavobacteriales bacterium]|nr:pilus assembly protein PilF [Flavobacteriales bacterium]